MTVKIAKVVVKIAKVAVKIAKNKGVIIQMPYMAGTG